MDDERDPLDRPPPPTGRTLGDWLVEIIEGYGGKEGLAHPCFQIDAGRHECWEKDYPTRHSMLTLFIQNDFGQPFPLAFADHHDEKEIA